MKTLERAAFYSVSAERRRANDLPVKETFFHLPSGAMAAGRITDIGADSMGRIGRGGERMSGVAQGCGFDKSVEQVD